MVGLECPTWRETNTTFSRLEILPGFSWSARILGFRGQP
jgi:hypothetical protein